MANDNTIGSTLEKQVVTPTPAGEVSKASSTEKKSTTSSSKMSEMGQNEFLTLLLNQLKTQDPLDPMKSEEFAVQLAQFSQLEQLIKINTKLEDSSLSGPNSMSSMAAYLGNEVVVKNAACQIKDGASSNLLVQIPEGTQSLRIDYTNDDGVVVARHTIDQPESGRQILKPTGIEAKDGDYSVRVLSVNSEGKFVDIGNKVTGTVEGFLLEPEPKLLVDGKEVSLEDIKEVHIGES